MSNVGGTRLYACYEKLPHAFASFAPFFWTLRTASAIWSMSERGPSSIVCVSQTATSQSWSFAGQCVFSRYSEIRSWPIDRLEAARLERVLQERLLVERLIAARGRNPLGVKRLEKPVTAASPRTGLDHSGTCIR